MLVLLVAVVTGAWADGIVCTASDKGKVLCTDGSIYENVSAATTAGKTAAAVIVYVDETNKGLAIALADEGSMNWSTAKSTCEGKTAITGVKWCLPSQDQWKQMFKANGGDDARYNGLNTTINTAGGTILQEWVSYWSSSEVNPGVDAYNVGLVDGSAYWGGGGEGIGKQVRACLAITAPTYAVKMKDATQAEAANWTIASGSKSVKGSVADGLTGLEENDPVTLTYSGRLKVKTVTATTDAVPVVYPMAAEATAADYGKVVCAAGHLHDAKTAVPKGCTAVAVFAYIDGSNNRYGIALQNAASKATWNTITSNGANKNKLCNVPGTWTVTAPTGAEWKVATKAIYEAMFINLGSTKSDSDGTTYDANVNAFITTGVGGTAISGDFWSTTEKSSTEAWCFRTNYWDFLGKSDIDWNVRPVLVW